MNGEDTTVQSPQKGKKRWQRQEDTKHQRVKQETDNPKGREDDLEGGRIVNKF